MTMFETRHIKMEPEQLKELMAEHDLSQSELADVVGTSQPAIALMCSGKRNITKKMTHRIYEGLEWYLKPQTPEERAAMEAWCDDYRKRNPIDEMTLRQLGGRVLAEDEDFEEDT